MLFNSFGYVFAFLPVAAVIYGIARKYVGQRSAQVWLLLASLFFYGSAKPSNLLLLGASMLFNWAVGWLLSSQTDSPYRKSILWAGLTVNIAFLFSFKYINLLLMGVAALHGPKFILPDLEFPLGISFFTLTQVMYLVDTYQAPETANSLFNHATFVSFFPYVTSGPISRSMEIVPQFKEQVEGESRMEMACRGIYLFALGLAKKVVFADSFARVADAGFFSTAGLSTLESWLSCLAFTFQIYFDFSGYSDMAMGSALMLGIEIPQNFDAPFRSLSISEYWQRWHMSLSAFITHYLYTPILRSMGGRATIRKSVVATILAMTIAGIWHGPSWTFAVYGLVHGLALATNQIWKRRKKRMPAWLSWIITFGFVNLSFVLFRSKDLAMAGRFYSYMLVPQENLFGISALRWALPMTPVTLVRPVVFGVVCAFFFSTSTDLHEFDSRKDVYLFCVLSYATKSLDLHSDRCACSRRGDLPRAKCLV
jgi:alginate O-acetyltransferase complex protein AlgI